MELHRQIDCLIDSCIDKSLTASPLGWVGADVWPDFKCCHFFFTYMCILVAQTTEELNNKNKNNSSWTTHQSVAGMIQWLSMNSVSVPLFVGNWVEWVQKRICQYNTATYRHTATLQAAKGLHHHVQDDEVFFWDAETPDKDRRGENVWIQQQFKKTHIWRSTPKLWRTFASLLTIYIISH